MKHILSEKNYKVSIVDSPLGKRNVDSKGSAISGVRLDPSRAYSQIPELLQKVINLNDQTAWYSIRDKIDYIYENLDYAMAGLNRETAFSSKVQSEIKSGKKLMFKPNLVAPQIIDSQSHGEAPGAVVCTEWPFVAALMRWFHDKLGINYSQMALGEASSSTFIIPAAISVTEGRTITTESVIEGRSGDFYGGWGFFFVRKYLASHHPETHCDDPMNGYEDSVTGKYYPPGSAGNRLMVYDLNKVEDNLNKGRTIAVPGGINFKEITLHKVIIGGNPQDENDVREYPGCVLVNVPKLKMHGQDLITNAIKNIGIGLYPLQKYGVPHTAYPSLKTKLPHSPWVFEIDEDTHMPLRDKNGKYIVTRTAGFSGTQSDVIKAVQSQNIFMLHVTDMINMINVSHDADGRPIKVPEGYVWSSLDCVALDLFCARYCFKTLPMLHGIKLKEERNLPTEFIRYVPVAKIKGRNIYSEVGLDSPLFRYDLYRYAQDRGIGQQKYYVTGWDSLTDTPFASIEGHLGRVDNTRFTEMMTKTMYYNYHTILHDLQFTILSYAKACDTLTGSSVYKENMETYDENKDGIIVYDEKGLGFQTQELIVMADAVGMAISQAFGTLKKGFVEKAFNLKYSNRNWNVQGHDFLKEGPLSFKTDLAFNLSQADTIRPDYFISGMFFGRGMWPSWQTATYVYITNTIYGSQSQKNISLGSMYGSAFQYADKVLNSGAYTIGAKPITNESYPYQYGDIYQPPVDEFSSAPDSITRYFDALSKGAVPLNFLLFVPMGYERLEGIKIPNVVETDDPRKIFTVHFNEVW